MTFLVSVTGFQVPGRPEEILFRPRPGPSFSAVPPQSGAPDARAEEVGEELIAGGKHISSQSVFVTPL